VKKTLLLLLWFCSHCYGQVFTIWNEAGQNISAIGMYQPSGGFTSGDWGLPSMTNGQGPITIYSSYFANIYCTPVANGTTTGIQSYVNGAGPWPGQTWGGGSNAQYYVVFVATGTTPSTSHVYTPATYTNDGCITLNNNTTQPQYYQVSATGPQGQISNASPCASSMVQTTSGGVSVYGSSAYGDANTWLAVYPGDIITVCQTILAGTNAGIWQMCALQAPAGLTPCGLSGIDNPRCVELCDDGQVVNGGAGWATGCQTMSQTSTPASSTSSGVNQGPLAGPNTQMDSGTNGIIWANNTNGGLMLNITGQTGFAALHNDLAAMNAAQAMEANGIGQTILNAQNAIVNAIRTNSASVILSNVVFSNQFTVTNWPTNYPDAAAIGWLSVIATNTGRTNGIDTNLDGLAAQIASNTAAPLAFTNLGLPSYSTNPSDTVTYAFGRTYQRFVTGLRTKRRDGGGSHHYRWLSR
jgi:hypothetical protein